MGKINDLFTELENSVFELSLKDELVYFDQENKYFARKIFKKRFLIQNSLYDGVLVKNEELDNKFLIDFSNENILISILPYFIIDNKNYVITRDNILSIEDINKAVFNDKKIVIFSFVDEKTYKLRGIILN